LERIRKKLGNPEVSSRFETEHESVRVRNLNRYGPGGWTTGRSYGKYRDFFDDGLAKTRMGTDFLGFIAGVPHDGRFIVHEYGPGQGEALERIGRELRVRGLPASTRAIDSFPHRDLVERHKRGAINDLSIERAELFRPEEQAHAVIDVLGPMNYVIPELRRDYFLKTAHSLAPGGVMLVGFNEALLSRPEDSPAYRRGVVGGLFGRRRMWSALFPGAQFEGDVRLAEWALKRAGFEARFFRYGKPGERHGWDFPERGLILRRPVKEKS